MKTRLFLLTVLGLGALHTSTKAQAPALAPAPADRTVAPAALPAAQPTPEPVLEAPPSAPQQTATPPLNTQPAAPPSAAPHSAPSLPPVTAYRTPQRYHLASPRLHAIEPRRHGNAGAPWTVAVGGSLLWRNDRAQRVLLDDERTGALELFAAHDVWSPFRGAVLALGASLRSERARGEDDQDLRSYAVQAEALARYGVTSWLWPHVRAAVGGVTTRLQQRDSAAGIDFEDRSGSALGTFGAGFTLRTPTRMFETHGGRLASLSMGVLVEGGYTVAKDADLTLRPTTDSEVQRATFSLGAVQRSAPYLRIMGVLRF